MLSFITHCADFCTQNYRKAANNPQKGVVTPPRHNSAFFIISPLENLVKKEFQKNKETKGEPQSPPQQTFI
jgi:hypothetical protein